MGPGYFPCVNININNLHGIDLVNIFPLIIFTNDFVPVHCEQAITNAPLKLF